MHIKIICCHKGSGWIINRGYTLISKNMQPDSCLTLPSRLFGNLIKPSTNGTHEFQQTICSPLTSKMSRPTTICMHPITLNIYRTVSVDAPHFASKSNSSNEIDKNSPDLSDILKELYEENEHNESSNTNNDKNKGRFCIIKEILYTRAFILPYCQSICKSDILL